ncbi:NAD-dependent epimerase/dehydratase family protein [Planctomycetota bacterium]
MKTLVTGGAGFIGSNLVKRLLETGDKVTVLDNLMSGYRSNLDHLSGVKFIEGDVCDEKAVNDAIQGVEVVYHLAASVGNKRSIDLPFVDAGINVMGTITVLEAARQANVRKIVSSSSAGIFGELKTLPIGEDHPVEPDSPYGCTKLCMEKLCLSYAKLYDIEAVCLRYFNVYGPNQRFDAYGNAIPIFAFKMQREEPITIFGDGEQTRDFVNVSDVVQANMLGAQAEGVSGAFNIGSGDRVTINRLIEMLQACVGIRAVVTHGPERPGDVRHSLADISAAQESFGFKPSVSLETGLREYMMWVAQQV